MSATSSLLKLNGFETVWYTLIGELGSFPNNPRLPLILYRGVLPFEKGADTAGGCSPDRIESLFGGYGWGSSWRNGIYSVHHYHSTAHEVLGIFSGEARVLLGGDAGSEVDLRAGDAVLIPAGVAHKNIGSSGDFRTIGAYPIGQTWDVCYGKEGERPQADRNIDATSRPMMDPVFGQDGPVTILWQ